MVRPSDCHPDRAHSVGGMCQPCYDRRRYVELDGRGAGRRRTWIRQGIDPDEAQAVWDSAGSCQVCGSTRRLSIDHDHATGRVRGLLCSECNFGIGKFDDDPDLVEKAARYLRGEA